MLPEHKDFKYRHIGPTPQEQSAMLKELGYSSLDQLMAVALPKAIQFEGEGKLPDPLTEQETLNALRVHANNNKITTSLIGQGYYGTFTPGVIKRNVLENPSWYTAYTPYQPEISQGRLEAIINFQTMVNDLTGMKTANASMLDESTAAAEAMLLSRRSSTNESQVFYVDSDTMPQTKSLLEHRAQPVGITIAYFDAAKGAAELTGEYFGVMVQYPGASGRLTQLKPIFDAAHGVNAMAVAIADLLALCLIAPPGEAGADMVVGTTQRFGVPMGFGGPHAGYLAVREDLERSMPGRLVGVSLDADGAPAYRLTLQTREQHIRRERATSNICTAQVLLAVMAGMYAVYHGPKGLRSIALEVHLKAHALADSLRAAGLSISETDFFDTFQVTGIDAKAIFAKGRQQDLTMRVVDESTIGISIDETISPETLSQISEVFGAKKVSYGYRPSGLLRVAGLDRKSEYLTHQVFNSHHSETAMLRYLKRLSDFDYALDRGMIPLGSCTMKLNSTTEMEAVTWPEFSNLHPFSPKEDIQGYLSLISELEGWLCDVTGYDAISLQPNAGSQGELAGLMAIRGYHLSRGDSQREICLIPSSAHGTNAASAVLAGMKVVVVACDELGNVDLEDIKSKISEAGDKLSALMVTYPSTHGVYEEAIADICEMVHQAGGQVYIDGANTNAVVGYAKFGLLGGDVSHLNLHKTFCIPHGGGGPGVGPIGVKSHLTPFLPGHAHMERKEGAVCAAPFGSASILPITWMYIRMMGGAGLKRASQLAILNANYISRRLEEHYPVLYTGSNGLVAHECILDLRPLKDSSGISVDDVAKRLIDFGFHAPTMSFPVAGTLMIEPTESESKEELDRFCDAMIRIREEIRAVENGTLDKDDNPLKNAPHTAAELVGEWSHPYSREQAVYPVASLIEGKYWPPVGRVDNVFGDRNLVCACPSIESYA